VKSPLQRRVGGAFGLAIGIIVVLGTLQYRASRQLKTENQWVAHTEDVLRELALTRDRLNRATAAAESFVITGEGSYVQTFSKTSTALAGQAQKLRALTADNPDQQQRLAALQPRLDNAIGDLQNEVNARTGGPLGREQALLLEDSIRKSSQDVRNSLSDMEQDEFQLLGQRRAAAEHSNFLSNSLILFGCVWAILLLGAAFGGLYIDVVARHRAEESRARALEALRDSHQALVKEAGKTAQAETSLRDSERSLRELSRHLLRSQDVERRRIGRDMHDSVGQYLSMVMMKLDVLIAAASSNGAAAVQEELKQCSKLVEESIREVRTISYLLHPPLLEEIGLKAAVPWYLDGFTNRSNIKTAFQISDDFGRLQPEVEMAFYRILQESLTNIHKHSGSDSADVRLYRKNGDVVMEVIDYGKGISPDIVNSSALTPEGTFGVGLRGMDERIRQLGGRLEVRGTGAGTVVRAVVSEQMSKVTTSSP
jgi:signal transduction histidine kinase